MLYFWIFVLRTVDDVPGPLERICAPIKVIFVSRGGTWPEQVPSGETRIQVDATHAVDVADLAASATSWLRAIRVINASAGTPVLLPSPVFDSSDKATAWFDANEAGLEDKIVNAVLYQIEPK